MIAAGYLLKDVALAARRRPGGYVWIMMLCGWLAGCAGPGAFTSESISAFQNPVELSAVPFFPQERYQCGPAALATVLSWGGVALTPDALVSEVYIPARQGSLQAEMLASSRRHGAVPYVLEPAPRALLGEVRAGHPVLVLLNLGLSWYPRWHYAVVVGFDAARQELILRSGTERRAVMSFAVFDHTWSRGGRWAAVVMPPAQLPQTAEELPYLNAVLPFEQMRKWEIAAAAYAAALQRWPESVAAGMGLGNSHYARADYPAAVAAYREVLKHHAGYAPALNNLAEALLQAGDLQEAERYALEAVAAGKGDARYNATLWEIRARLIKP